jgi:leucyl-tRNA synthetase
MPFIKFKKNETLDVDGYALDLTLPFGEIEVLEENAEFITSQLLLEKVKVYSYSDVDARAMAGVQQTQLNQKPPIPGNLVAAFLSTTEAGLAGLRLA